MDTNKLDWEFLKENVKVKHLAKDESKNIQFDLVRLEPNAKIVEHIHADFEWVYVIDGSMSDENNVYEREHFINNKAGSKHNVVAGPDGCLIIAVWCGKHL